MDLTRFGTLTEAFFNMKEGPADPADMVPRLRGPGTGLNVSILLPKEEVAWVIGKRGSKIGKLRERARVNVNDADSPPFPPAHVVLEISGAPLKEELYVLQLMLDDLAVRPDVGNSTRLLLPAEHFGEVCVESVLAEIKRESGVEDCFSPDVRPSGPLRSLEVKGSERERLHAATLAYERVERARGDGPQPSLDVKPTGPLWEPPARQLTQPTYVAAPSTTPAPAPRTGESIAPLAGSVSSAALGVEKRTDAPPSGCLLGAKQRSFTLSVLLPAMDVANFLASGELGIARRTGCEVVALRGDGGEASLSITGLPEANAAACLVVQRALWLHGFSAPFQK